MMKNKSKGEITNITDKLAKKYLIRKSLKYANNSFVDEKDRLKAISFIKYKTLFIAGIYGVLGVILLYLPQYIFSDVFKKTEYTVPYIKYSFGVSAFELIYGFILVAIEIYLLIINDIKAVGKIISIYGYNAKNENFEADEFISISLGKDKTKFIKIGINPYQEFSKTSVLLLRILLISKAFLSNFVMKMVLKKVLGRLAIRAIIDLAGIPIYALWNAYASSIVIRKTTMRMQAQTQMKKTGKYFLKKYKNNSEFTELIYDTFSFIAISKKNFYPTDYIYAKHFFNIFNIEHEKEHTLTNNYIEKINKLPYDIKLAIGQILILGFLLDGKIGRFEIKSLKKLIKNNIILYSISDIKKWTNDYKLGSGFDGMFEKNKN